MERVIFACVHNAGRSQMAAAFFTSFADPSRAQATSAGTHPADHIHPEVIEVMQEVGIDLSAIHPQLLSEDVARAASCLITMGCGDECPYVPASTSSEVDADPAAQPSTIQRVPRMHRSRENRYLLRSRATVHWSPFDVFDRADDRDNFRDNHDQIGSPVTCTLAYT